MSQEKLELVFKLKELNDPQCVEMLAQFMQYLMQNQTGSSGGTSKRGAKNLSKEMIHIQIVISISLLIKLYHV